MQITEISIDIIKPYENNAKKHPIAQIDNVAASIKQFGFVQPIVIDTNNVIVIGHCRLEAAKKLSLDTVPCYYVEDLTAEQINALRLADNKLNESAWDTELLLGELDEIKNIDMEALGFNLADFEALDLDYDDMSGPEEIQTKNICSCPKCGFSFEVSK